MTIRTVKLGTVLALLSMIALSACGNGNDNDNANSPGASAPSGGGQTIEVTQNAVNWEFSQPEIKAKVGDTLKMTLNNEKGAHGIEITDLGVKIANGETATVTLDKAGTYEFHCNIQCGQGHDNMVGQIIVE